LKNQLKEGINKEEVDQPAINKKEQR